jgi:glycosyltransferase involved in cell wall biosynthesis
VRIADVSPRVVFPPQRGSGIRTYNLLRHLSERHDVRQFSQNRDGRLLSPRSGETVPLTERYEETRFSHPLASLVGERAERSWVTAPVASGAALHLLRPRRLLELLEWAEVVLVEFPWQFAFCKKRSGDVPLVLASHNVELDKFRSYAEYVRPHIRAPWLRAIRRMEANAVHAADLVVAVSGDDRRRLVDLYGIDPERIVVVPNGVDTERYRPVSAEARRAARRRLGLPERPTVTFAGSAVPPNRAGLRVVERLSRAAPQFTFLVLGPVSQRRSDGNLIATGRVDDVRPWLEAGDASLCPIRYGGGTKIKLLEALAAGLPTVAFEQSLDGTELCAGEHVLVSPDEDGALVESLERLAGDPALAESIATAGRRFVAERHDWRRLARTLEDALVPLVSSASPHTRATR